MSKTKDFEKMYKKHLAEQELFRRRYFRLDDESRKIRKMSDSELEDLIAANLSETQP